MVEEEEEVDIEVAMATEAEVMEVIEATTSSPTTTNRDPLSSSNQFTLSNLSNSTTSSHSNHSKHRQACNNHPSKLHPCRLLLFFLLQWKMSHL